MAKKLLFRFLTGFLTTILIVLATATTVWLNPDWVLTEKRIDQLFDRFVGPYFSQRPEKIQFVLKSNGLFGKKVELDLTTFCLVEPEGCFDRFHIEFSFRFLKPTRVELQSLGPIVVLNRSLQFHEKQKNITPADNSSFDLFKYLSVPRDLVVNGIEINSPQIILPAKAPLVLSVDLKGTSEQFHAEASAHSPSGLKALASIDTSVSLADASHFKAKIEAKDGWTIEGNLEGLANWRKLEADVKGNLEIKKLIPWVHRLSVKNIELTRKETLKLSASIEASVEPQFDIHRRDSALPHISFVTDVNGKLDIEEKDEGFDYRLQIGPLVQNGLELLANAEGKFPFPKESSHRYGLDRALIKLSIPSFQGLVQKLRLTSSAIPAPFSALKGRVVFRAGNEDASIKNDTLPIQLVTQLNSTEQAINTQSDGQLTFERKRKKVKIEGSSRIELIRFTLPDLDLLTPQPAIAGDSRIISLRKYQKNLHEEAAKKTEEVTHLPADSSESVLELNWKVTTASSGIQVHHPIFAPYAPAEVDWVLAGTGSHGEIRLLPFKVDYLNRTAKLEHLRYYLKPNDKIFHYDGKLTIPKTDYTLFISVYDQSGKPKVEFSSEPPLSEADIISVLLFNQTTAELTPDESGSVANTQAAVTNRALGLFSIWALSSTPIEAVNFDPAKKVYSARVRLASGLTASIGTDWENTQEVALRKRLGRNFVLSTSVQTDKETNTESKKTLLEWFRRF